MIVINPHQPFCINTTIKLPLTICNNLSTSKHLTTTNANSIPQLNTTLTQLQTTRTNKKLLLYHNPIMSNVPERILKKMRDSIPKRPQIQLVDDLNYPEPPKNNASASASTVRRRSGQKRTSQLKATATSSKARRLSGNTTPTRKQSTPCVNDIKVRKITPVATQPPITSRPPKQWVPGVPSILHHYPLIHWDQCRWRGLLLTQHSKASRNGRHQRRNGV